MSISEVGRYLDDFVVREERITYDFERKRGENTASIFVRPSKGNVSHDVELEMI